MTAPQIEIGGAWKGLSSGQVYVGTTWRNITRGSYYDGVAWKPVATFIPAMTLSVDPITVDATTFSHIVAHVSSGPITATPSGGLGPFSYAHTFVSTDGLATISAPSSAVTTVSATLPPNASSSSNLRCTATDSRGTQARADYTVTLRNISDF